ncbi:TetR/AcrR family transcriptional regulator [Maritimibacter sp. DP1N21-5]|uniref:TetR/AcrR family transcriptional regulator n=1 Tax=Maritimibacter sp. DP1N21-5 TaxID=2836867 RepID=UPI001C45F40A|nr:TetR/AcrR family transcriptional regulator [Maritimibacter sp. DP1N21-5]MBV7409303.1 TetR/AcrR family transcriptional regulator [Maritimibacter sp. DP1N21-5]
MARSIARDHDEKRAAILRGAARVFARDGFDRASMTQLARECGISKANVYHYYTSKDAILYDVLDGYLADLTDRVTGLDLGGATPEDALRRVVVEIMLAYEGADDEHRVQMSGVDLLPPDQQRVLKGYQRQIVDFVAEILAHVAPGLKSNGPKLRQATMALFGMLNWYYMWSADAGRAERVAYAELVAEMTLGGLRAL